MMDFIMAPLIVGIVTLGIYKLFELFARRKERMAIIEKMGDKFDPSMIGNPFPLSFKTTGNAPYGTLKVACLLLGIGLGLLVGFFIVLNTIGISSESSYHFEKTEGAIYGASVLLFGGLGLLIAFLVEMKHEKKIEK
jgi:hypothetical protein